MARTSLTRAQLGNTSTPPASRNNVPTGKCRQPLECGHLLRSIHRGAIERRMKHLDGPIVGFAIDRERRAVFTAVRGSKARRGGCASRRAVNEFGRQGERAYG